MGSYFLCSKSEVPKLVAKAKAEADQILKEFSMFYRTAGTLSITIEPIQHGMGWSIGGKLLWDNSVVREESDCGLLFLTLNDVMINRMLQLGIPSFGK